jgi:hypothetical protein
MGRSQLVVLSILISHQHLLHTIQPLPPSSFCISSVSGLAGCRAFLSDAPASHHCQRNYETAGSLRSLGITPVHRYFEPFRHLLAFLPFPVQPVIGRTCSRVFLSGTRKVSPVRNMSLSPCCPYHPAGTSCRIGQRAPCHVAFIRRQKIRLPDLSFFRGHFWDSLSLQPAYSLTILSDGFVGRLHWFRFLHRCDPS